MLAGRLGHGFDESEKPCAVITRWVTFGATAAVLNFGGDQYLNLRPHVFSDGEGHYERSVIAQ